MEIETNTDWCDWWAYFWSMASDGIREYLADPWAFYEGDQREV